MLRRLLPTLALALVLPGAAQAASFGSAGPASAPASPKAALHKAQAAIAGRGVKAGAEVTLALKDLALSLPSLRGADRTRALRLLARPTQNEGSASELEYTVPEHKPALCSDHFCIHWVSTTEDAPPLTDSNHNGIPDYVETMDQVFEHVYDVENNQLGWSPPKSDGTRGCTSGSTNCSGKTDVYIKELGNQGIYGYSAPDPGQRSLHQAAYLVLDNDYNATQFPKYAGDPLQPMEVTAAHEYNHVLQFNYDAAQDTWMFEATATWMEDRVYTDVNDYLQYLTPWARMSTVPLTQFNASNASDPANVKVYGDAVWNRWIDARYGPETVRDAWADSLRSRPKSFAPGAYDLALRAKGTSFYAAFAAFATATAEWRASNSAFAEGATFPDIQRVADSRTRRPIVLRPDLGGAAGRLAHTAFILMDVSAASSLPRLKLAVDTPRGTRMAIALVGRTGDETSGVSSEFITLLPHGGPGTVTVDNPGRYTRLTAVVINADASAKRFSTVLGDWVWQRDAGVVNVRASTDDVPPAVRRRSPPAGARAASTRTGVKVTFSERMFVIDSRTVKLLSPGGHSVKASLRLRAAGKSASSAAGADEVVIVPRTRLRKGTRYTVQLSRDLRDRGGNALPASALSWTFRTKR